MNKKIITAIATGFAVAGIITFLFKSEKGAALRKKIFEHGEKPSSADIPIK